MYKDSEILKRIIASVFIKAYKENNHVTTKTQLANIICTGIAKQNTTISSKTLLNYFNQFFGTPPKSFNPSDYIIDALLQYLDKKSIKEFALHQPADKGYLSEVPFLKQREEAKKPKREEKATIKQQQKSGKNSINIQTTGEVYFGYPPKSKGSETER
jgi:hypothetical protein